jgi:hypothetical protein
MQPGLKLQYQQKELPHNIQPAPPGKRIFLPAIFLISKFLASCEISDWSALRGGLTRRRKAAKEGWFANRLDTDPDSGGRIDPADSVHL